MCSVFNDRNANKKPVMAFSQKGLCAGNKKSIHNKHSSQNMRVCVCSHSQASVSGSALQSPHGDPQHSFSEEEHHTALQHHNQELQPNTTPKVPCPLGGSWRLFSLFEYVQEITLCIFQADLNVCR